MNAGIDISGSLATLELPISPLVGEMAGKPEGGAVPLSSPFGADATGVMGGRSTLPPSALPGISPTRGEIGSVTIVAEQPADIFAREALLDAAMGPGRKRKSSEKLRRGRKPSEGLAFVARDGSGRVVGTVRLWDVAMKRPVSPLVGEMSAQPTEGGAVLPASHVVSPPSALPGISPTRGVTGGCDVVALLLGPLAVDPLQKSAGIGSALMRHAIAEATRLGHGAILLVGDAPYYARFGFSAEKTDALAMPGPFEKHRLLALELQPGALDGAAGVIRAAGRKLASRRAADAAGLPVNLLSVAA